MGQYNAPQIRSAVDWRLQFDENNKVNRLINSSLNGIKDTGRDLLNMAGRDERKMVAQDKRDYQANALAAMTSANSQKELSDIYAKASENKMIDMGKLQGILQKKENQIRANADELANRNRIIDMYNTKQQQYQQKRREDYDARVLANEYKRINLENSIFNQDRNFKVQQDIRDSNAEIAAMQNTLGYKINQASQKTFIDAAAKGDIAAQVVIQFGGDEKTYQLLKNHLDNNPETWYGGGINQNNYQEVYEAFKKMTKG